MSKLSKLIKHPYRYFRDAYKNVKKKNTGKTISLPTAKIAVIPVETKVKAKTINSPLPQLVYHKQILDFIVKHPVNDITYKDIHFWPFLRNELMIQLNIAWIKQNIKVPFNPYQSQLCTRKNVIDYWRPQLTKHYGFVEIEDLKVEEPVDFLFFTNLNSSDHVEVKGQYYNRILDPIMEIASTIGSVKKIEIIKAKSPAIEKLQKYTHKPVAILPPRIHTSGHFSYLNYHKNFFLHWNAAIPTLSLTEKNIEDFADWSIHMTLFYKEILKKYSPKAVFFHPYYYYTPLVLAAHELGIKSVDVQHGIQSGENPVYYDNFNEIPSEGYAALPDYFWVWSNNDKVKLDKSLKGTKHKTIVGGYPWFEKQKEVGNACSEKLNSIIANYEKVILVTMQHQPAIPQVLLQIIQNSPNSYLWLIRSHPKGCVIQKSGILNKPNIITGDLVNKPSLYSLLSKSDLHLTASSTVVVEADYFGVPSAVWDDTGIMNYEDMISQEKVYPVRTTDELVTVIKKIEAHKNNYTHCPEHLKIIAVSALQEIIEKTENN